MLGGFRRPGSWSMSAAIVFTPSVLVTARPTVVLESALAASSLSWARVQPDVARFTSVCAYDRAGLGWSDASTSPRTFTRTLDELHAVLTQLKCTAPYVMVGHSFGVFVCLAYAARYPQTVGGLVLVDPPTEWVHVDHRQMRLLWGAVQLSRLGGLLARLGVVRVCLALLTGGAPAAPRHFVKVFGPMTARTLERLVGEVRKLPPEIHPVVQALWCQPKCFQAMADQLRMLEDATASAARGHFAGRRATGRDLECRPDARRHGIASRAGANVIPRPRRARVEERPLGAV